MLLLIFAFSLSSTALPESSSILTLSPAGHNPESFRIWEAIEAGSIPVISIADVSYKNHPCKGSLHRMLDSGAPIVILNKWDELFPTIDALLSNQTALNERQQALQLWYKRFMDKMIWKFEELFLGEGSD